MSVLIETSLGDVVMDLYVKRAPKACLNFVKLCKKKYYNFCLFPHKLIKNYTLSTVPYAKLPAAATAHILIAFVQ